MNISKTNGDAAKILGGLFLLLAPLVFIFPADVNGNALDTTKMAITFVSCLAGIACWSLIKDPEYSFDCCETDFGFAARKTH